MDVDPEAGRTDPDGPVREQDQGERRRGGRLLLVEEILEQLREHLTEELPYLKQEELHLRRLHLRRRLQPQEEQHLLTEELLYLKKDKLRGQHLREQSMLLEVEHQQVEDKLQEQPDKLGLQDVTEG